MLDTIVLVKDLPEITHRCLSGVKKHFPEANLILVDNGSKSKTVEMLPQFGEVIRNEENVGFPAGVNQGLAHSTSEWVCLLNNDVIIPSGFGQRIEEILADLPKECGIFGPMAQLGSGWQVLPFPEWRKGQTSPDIPQKIVDDFCENIYKAYGHYHKESPRLVGFCVFIRREVIKRLGGLDERFGLGCYEDDDYCWRAIAAGWKLYVFYGLFLYHICGSTFGYNQDATEEKIEEYNQNLLTNWFYFSSKWKIPNGQSTMKLQIEGRLLPPRGERVNQLIHIPLTNGKLEDRPTLVEVA